MVYNKNGPTTFIIFLVICIACSGEQSSDLPAHIRDIESLTVYTVDNEPASRIHFIRERSFGDTEKIFINRITDVAVDRKNLVYIADGEELDIKVYEPDGGFLTRLGRQGDGPGEFIEISNIQIRNYRLFAFDRNKQQAVVFLTDSLVYSHTVPIAANRSDVNELRGAYLNRYYLRGDNTFLMKFSVPNTAQGEQDWGKIKNSALYYLLDENGDIVSGKLFDRTSSFQVLLPFGGRSVGMPVQFYGTLLTALTNDEHIYLAWSEDFLIKRYSPDGKYEDAFYYPFRRTPMVPETAFPEASPELIREAVQSMDLPKTLPALNEMLIDNENRLWVSTIVKDFDTYEWWVLEATGELIAKFEWPRDEPIEVIRNGYMYTRETDEATDLQQIVRYRIEMEKI